MILSLATLWQIDVKQTQLTIDNYCTLSSQTLHIYLIKACQIAIQSIGVIASVNVSINIAIFQPVEECQCKE